MSDRFKSRADLASKIEWEGGILESVDYGIKPEDMPEGEAELTDAWRQLVDAYAKVTKLADRVAELLPELE